MKIFVFLNTIFNFTSSDIVILQLTHIIYKFRFMILRGQQVSKGSCFCKCQAVLMCYIITVIKFQCDFSSPELV